MFSTPSTEHAAWVGWLPHDAWMDMLTSRRRLVARRVPLPWLLTRRICEIHNDIRMSPAIYTSVSKRNGRKIVHGRYL